jgi:hypothetical protein
MVVFKKMAKPFFLNTTATHGLISYLYVIIYRTSVSNTALCLVCGQVDGVVFEVDSIPNNLEKH